MTAADLDDIERAWVDDRIGTHWDGCHLAARHHGCAVAKLVAEVKRLRALLLSQGERIAVQAELLSKKAERMST